MINPIYKVKQWGLERDLVRVRMGFKSVLPAPRACTTSLSDPLACHYKMTHAIRGCDNQKQYTQSCFHRFQDTEDALRMETVTLLTTLNQENGIEIL